MSQFYESSPLTGGRVQSIALDSQLRTSHSQVVHNIALVLGGGGAAGMPGRSVSSPVWPKLVSI